MCLSILIPEWAICFSQTYLYRSSSPRFSQAAAWLIKNSERLCSFQPTITSLARIGRDYLLEPSNLPHCLKHPRYPLRPMKFTSANSLSPFFTHTPLFKTLRDPALSNKCTSSMPTVSLNVNYIIYNPDRLFKTVSDGFRCSKMLWRYVGII